MIINWIKIFIYHLKQNKLFSFLNVLGLGIGISGVILAILYWNNEHSYDQWNPEKENIYQVSNKISATGDTWSTSTIPFGNTCKATIPEIEQICFVNCWYNEGVLKYQNQKLIADKVTITDNGFFSMFPFPIIKGSKTDILKTKNSVAISDEAAKLVFKNEDPIGKSINYDDNFYVVKAIYKIIKPSGFQPDYVFSGIVNERDLNSWGNYNYGLFIKIKKGVAVETVLKKMQNVNFVNRTLKDAKENGQSVEQYVKENGETKVFLDQLKTARLHGIKSGIGNSFPEGSGNLQLLYIMAGLSILILILSLVNYINLATASAIKRAKEVGVRKIVGATKSQIIMQFIFETVIIVGFSVLMSLAIVELSLPYFNDFLRKDMDLKGSEFYLEVLFIFMVVIVFAGLLPAIYISNFETLKVLKGNFSRSKSGIWLRNSMLVIQFAIASFFIIGALVVYEQVDYMMNKDLGFSGSQVMKIKFNVQDYKKKLGLYETTKQEMLKMPGIERVSTFAGSFGSDTNSTSGFTHNGVFVQGHNVDMDYGMLDMMKIKVLKGRDLSSKFASDTVSNMLMNETCVKTLKMKNPVNTIITSGWGDEKGNLKFKIVGVVQDFHISGFQAKIPLLLSSFSTYDL
ncbi:MAG: ABC transporter permease [Flavobacteriaceae bacterium]|nr:ABC transporter permease [Flavobacteriaceae bacterium]